MTRNMNKDIVKSQKSMHYTHQCQQSKHPLEWHIHFSAQPPSPWVRKERTMRQRTGRTVSVYIFRFYSMFTDVRVGIKQIGIMCIFPLYLAIHTFDLHHKIVHVEFNIFLWQHLQEQEFKLQLAKLKRGYNKGLSLSFLPSWWLCQLPDPVCSGTAAHCCRSLWYWRICLSNKMQFPYLKKTFFLMKRKCRENNCKEPQNWQKVLKVLNCYIIKCKKCKKY